MSVFGVVMAVSFLSGRVFAALGREDIKIEHRHVADHDTVMLDVRWEHQQIAGREPAHLAFDMEVDLAFENVDDLLVGMAARPRLVSWLKPVQRYRGALAGKRL